MEKSNFRVFAALLLIGLVTAVLIILAATYLKTSDEYTATIVEEVEIDPLKVEVEAMRQQTDSILMMLDTIDSLEKELEENIRLNIELRKAN